MAKAFRFPVKEKYYKKNYKLIISGYPDFMVGSSTSARRFAKVFRKLGCKVKIIPVKNGRAIKIGKYEYIGPY